MTDSKLTLTQAAGKPAFILDRLCDRSQILVTVCRNGKQWLSPVGWVDGQKGTLLDCRPAAEQTEILIPDDYAAQISAGDELHISCYELEFEQDIVWAAPEVEVAAAGGVGALLGRLRAPKAATPIAEPMSDSAKRAAELQREADEIRARVETAKVAQEKAHQRALDMARQAEEARKAEDARIAEMEQAKQALKAAEESRRAELREIEEARRAEAAIRAEEARLAEEARKLEQARAQQAALREQRAALAASMDDIKAEARAAKDQEAQLVATLSAVTDEADTIAAQYKTIEDNAAEESKNRLELQRSLATAQSETDALAGKAKAAQAYIDDFRRRAGVLTDAADKAQNEWQEAQRIAEEAAARAAGLKKAAKQAEAARDDIQAQTEAANQEHQAVATALNAAQKAGQEAELRFNAASRKVSDLEAELLKTSEADQGVRARQTDIRGRLAHAQAQVSAAKARKVAAQKAISIIDAGGDQDAVNAALKTADADIDRAPAEPQSPPPTAGVSRKRFKIRRRAAALAATPSAVLTAGETDVDAEADGVALEPASDSKPASTAIAFANDEDSSHDLRRALYAGVAAIAVVGITGFGVSKMWTASAEIPAKTAPQIAQAPEVTVNVETLTPAPVTDAPALEEAIVIAPAAPIIAPEPEMKNKVAEPKAAAAAVIPAIPGLVPTGGALKNAKAAAAVKLAAATKPAPARKAVKTDKTAAVIAPKPKPAAVKAPAKAVAKPKPPAPEQTRAFLEVRKDVQTRLSDLGFYTGEIDGLAGGRTDRAVIEFKTLFGLPQNSAISGAFLNALKSASAADQQAKSEPAVVMPAPVYSAPEPIYVAVQASTAEPVDTAPAPQITAPVIAAPVITPEPSTPVQVASLEPIAPAPVAAPVDTIIDAKRLKGIAGAYPKRAIQRGFYDTIAVSINYDVSPKGEVINAKISALEPTPRRYAAEFEKAGLKAVSGQKFAPKTVNGEPVASTGHNSRITFRTQ